MLSDLTSWPGLIHRRKSTRLSNTRSLRWGWGGVKAKKGEHAVMVHKYIKYIYFTQQFPAESISIKETMNL